MICIDRIENITIGRLLDNETARFEFDLSRWMRDYPALVSYHIEVISPAGVEYIAGKVERDDDILAWTITSADTAAAGRGSFRIVGLGPDGERKSSETGVLKVINSMPEFAAGEAPEPMRPFVDEVIDAANRAEEAAKVTPYVGENGNWMVWDGEAGTYKDSGISAKGEVGPAGPAGPAGEGIAEVMVVAVTDYANKPPELDKTFDEIKTALESGMIVELRDGVFAYRLKSQSDRALVFTTAASLPTGGQGGRQRQITVWIDGSAERFDFTTDALALTVNGKLYEYYGGGRVRVNIDIPEAVTDDHIRELAREEMPEVPTDDHIRELAREEMPEVPDDVHIAEVAKTQVTWENIPDKPFGATLERPVVLEKTVVKETENGTQTGQIASVIQVTAGKKYIATWNDVEYECTAVKKELEGIMPVWLGNIGVLTGGESTGEPFAIAAFGEEEAAVLGYGGLVAFLDGSTGATLKIEDAETTEIKTLDPVYLPMGVDETLVDRKTAIANAGKLLYVAGDGEITPLTIGGGLAIVEGVLTLTTLGNGRLDEIVLG